MFWEKGDLFLSLRNLSAIVHYRPSNNKIINYITGPFIKQHDVDIISDEEIMIFNNNNVKEKIQINFQKLKKSQLFHQLLYIILI